MVIDAFGGKYLDEFSEDKVLTSTFQALFNLVSGPPGLELLG